jgi:hypothetical protein
MTSPSMQRIVPNSRFRAFVNPTQAEVISTLRARVMNVNQPDNMAGRRTHSPDSLILRRPLIGL